MNQPGNSQQKQDTKNHGQHQSDGPGFLLIFFREVTTKYRDENNIVDTKYDFQ